MTNRKQGLAIKRRSHGIPSPGIKSLSRPMPIPARQTFESYDKIKLNFFHFHPSKCLEPGIMMIIVLKGGFQFTIH